MAHGTCARHAANEFLTQQSGPLRALCPNLTRRTIQVDPSVYDHPAPDVTAQEQGRASRNPPSRSLDAINAARTRVVQMPSTLLGPESSCAHQDSTPISRACTDPAPEATQVGVAKVVDDDYSTSRRGSPSGAGARKAVDKARGLLGSVEIETAMHVCVKRQQPSRDEDLATWGARRKTVILPLPSSDLQ